MTYAHPMRTTLDIDEDVLQAAKERAAAQRTSIGKALSELARQSLSPRGETSAVRNGVPLLAPRSGEELVTMEHVNRLRDDG